MTISSKNTRGATLGPVAKLRDLFRSVRLREADAILAHYANGRLTDAAEREMTERLLHRYDSFRF